jgi:NAD-dependent SIR2 family protein deacetylase
MLAMIEAQLADLTAFVRAHSPLLVLTGAGLSTASGIPAYRDERGEWRSRRRILHNDFMTRHAVRQRYWARSMAGFPLMRDAQPNAGHRALAALEAAGFIKLIVTQNVDRLQQRAGGKQVVDLHGRIDQIICTGCRARSRRDDFQRTLLAANPGLAREAAQQAPDGDADLSDIRIGDVVVPACDDCAGILKPNVVFYGGGVPKDRVDMAMAALQEASAVLVAGSSLQVFSGYRFCREAKRLGKPVAAINRGTCRGDPDFDLKLWADVNDVLPSLVTRLKIS